MALPDWLQQSLDSLPLTPPPAPAPPKSNLLMAGLMAGYHGMLGSGGQAAEAVGKATGVSDLEQWGQAKAAAEAQKTAAAALPEYETTLPTGISQAIPWAGYNLAKSLPTLAGVLGGAAAIGTVLPETAAGMGALRAVGAVAPRWLGGAAGATGEAAEATAAHFAHNAATLTAAGAPEALSQLYGAEKAKAEAEGRDTTQLDAIKAIAGTPILSAVGSVMPGGLQRIMEEGAAGNTARRMLTSGGVQAVLGGPQAAVSTAIAQQFGPDKSFSERTHEIIDNAIAGTVMGGLTGAGFGYAFKAKEAPDVLADPNLPGAIDEFLQPKQLPPPPGERWNFAPDVVYAGGELQGQLGQDRPAGLLPPPPGRDPNTIEMGDAAQQPIHMPGELQGQLGADQRPALTGPGEPNPIALPDQSSGPTLHLPLEGAIDENGQRTLPGMEVRPYGGAPTDELTAEVQRIADLKEQGKHTKDDISNGVAILRELSARRDAGDITKQPSLIPEDDKQFERGQNVAQTRATLATENVPNTKNYIAKLDAADKVEAYNKVQDALGSSNPPDGAIQLAKAWGMINEDGKPRNIGKDIAKLSDQLDQTHTKVKTQEDIQKANAKAADLTNQIDKLRALQKLQQQAVARRAQDSLDAENALTKEARKASLGLDDKQLDRHDSVPETSQPTWKSLEAIRRNPDLPPEMLPRVQKAQAKLEGVDKPPKMAEINAGHTIRAAAKALEAKRALQEQSANPVDAREPTGPGAGVRGGDIPRDGAAGSGGEAAPQTEAKAPAAPKGRASRSQAQIDAAEASLTPQEPPVVPEANPVERERLATLRAKQDMEAQRAQDRINQQIAKARAKNRVADRAAAPPAPAAGVDELIKGKIKGSFSSHSDPAEQMQHVNQDITDLSEQGADVKQHLDYLARTSKQSDMRDIANALKRANIKSAVKVGPDEYTGPEHGLSQDSPYAGKPRTASYNDLTDTIGLHSGDFAWGLLHETTHAGAHAAIDSDSPTAGRLKTLFEKAQKALGYTDAYGLESVHEFVAEAFSNPWFRELLRSLPSDKKTSIWQAFKNVIFKMLKLPERTRTMLDDVMETGNKLIDEQNAMSPDAVHQAAVLRNRVQTIFSGKNADMPRNPAQADAHVGIFARMAKETASDILEKAHLGGWETIRDKTQKGLMGWETLSGLARAVEKILPNASTYTNLFRGGHVVHEMFNHIHGMATKPAKEYQRTNKQGGELLDKLMADAARMRFDPAKIIAPNGRTRTVEDAWAQHPHLHEEKDVAQLRKDFDTFYKEAGTLRQLGGMKHFEALRQIGDMDDLSKLAVTAHELMKGVGLDVGDHPTDVFQMNDQLRVDPTSALKYWRAQTERYSQIMGERIKDLNGQAAPIEKTDPEKFKALKDAADPLKEMQSKLYQMRARVDQAPNFHFGRNGNFFVSGHFKLDADKNISRDDVQKLQDRLVKADFKGVNLSGNPHESSVFIRVETPDQMARLYDVFKQAHEDGLLDKTKDVNRGSPDQVSTLKGMLPQYLERAFKHVLADDMWNSEAAGAVKGAVREQLHGILMDMYPDTSLNRMMQHRRDVPGFNKNMVDNAIQRSLTNANAISKLSFQPRINTEMSAMRARLQELKADPKATPGQIITAQNAISEYALRMQQRPWRVQNGFLNQVRALNHLWRIGISPAYGIEILSQNHMLLWPTLAARHGWVKAASTMARVTPMAAKIMRAIWQGPDRISGRIDRDVLLKGGIPADITDTIIRTANRGGVDMGSMSMEIIRDADQGLVGGAYKKMHQVSSGFAIYAETFSRVLSTLAAKELHSVDKRADKGTVENYIDHVISKSQMNWNYDENPRMVGQHGLFGSLSPVMLTFKGYEIRLIELLYNENSKMWQGDPEAKAFLAAHLAATISLAGTLGIPGAALFAGAATKLANTLTQSDEFDVEASYRRWLTGLFGHEVSEVLSKGAPRALGADTSHLGEGEIIPFTDLMTNRRKFEDAVPEWTNQMAGSPFGLASSVILGVRDAYDGNYLQGAAKMMPAMLKNPFQAARMTAFGYEDHNGEKLPIQPDVADILMQAVGIAPEDKAAYDEKARALSGYKEDHAFYSANVQKNLLIANERSDPADKEAQMAKALDWVKAHPYDKNFLPSLGSKLIQRQVDTANARAAGTPLHTNIKNPAERGLVGW